MCFNRSHSGAAACFACWYHKPTIVVLHKHHVRHIRYHHTLIEINVHRISCAPTLNNLTRTTIIKKLSNRRFAIRADAQILLCD
jgi:hypothetical protein